MRLLGDVRTGVAVGLALSSLLGACSPANEGTPGSGELLVADATSIKRIDPDTRSVKDVVVGLDAPSFVAADRAGRRIFWTTRSSLFSATWDGKNVNELRNDLDGGRGLVLDGSNAKLYWAEEGARRVRRSNLDGSGAEDVLANLGAPWDLALDPTGRWLYVADPGFERIQSVDLESAESTPTDVVAAGDNPVGIALDPGTASLYWTSSSIGTIERAGLDGVGRESAVQGLTDPIDVALDVATRELFWTDLSGLVYRSEDEGTNPQVIASGLASPIGLALY